MEKFRNLFVVKPCLCNVFLPARNKGQGTAASMKPGNGIVSTMVKVLHIII